MTPFLDAAPIRPLSAEYHNTLQPADTSIPPTQSVSKLFMSGNGMTRMDFGDTSVISDPAAQKTVFLDHLKKEARVVPFQPPEPPKPEMPELGAPAAPPPPPEAPAPISVKDLGKRFLDGHEVQGKQFVFPPPVLPEPPKMPEPPKPPEMPKAANVKAKLPEPPKLAEPPKPPEPPKPEMPEMPPPPPLKETVSEVWSSTSLFIPMLSRTISSWGKQVSHCKSAIPGEPDPALFQIPPDYNQLEGFQNEPKPPDMPKLA